MIYYDIPILYIPFKRLNIVKDVFLQIKAIKPQKLYIAQDGARDDKEKEELEKILGVKIFMCLKLKHFIKF